MKITIQNKEEIKSKLIDMLVDYAANSISSVDMLDYFGGDIDEAEVNVLKKFQHDWDAVECDEEGPSNEQNQELDNILASYADQLIEAAIANNK